MTGLYRAVKVVRREDFEFEKTFGREFEGIKRYERVSQGHPGLVDVLHVGREPGKGYYYYVMELADDVSGVPIDQLDPQTYVPRTLFSDLRGKQPKSIRDCIELGRDLAEALSHLHESGLTHRDVKPPNIIFVGGKARLADIGLVAEAGQKTFVGTEGYVPPEGPGAPAADLFALAMVLYEVHTGKDRFEFPELPTNQELSPTVNRDEWRRLNTVICKGGAPDPSKRFRDGHSFSQALQSVVADPDASQREWLTTIQDKTTEVVEQVKQIDFKEIDWKSPWVIGPAALVGMLMVILSILAIPEKKEPEPEPMGPPLSFSRIKPIDVEENPDEERIPMPIPLPKPQGLSSGIPKAAVPPGDNEPVGLDGTSEPDQVPLVAVPVTPVAVLAVTSDPPGAEVFLDGRSAGRTPLQRLEVTADEEVELIIRAEGHIDFRVVREFEEGSQFKVNHDLVKDYRPVPGRPWENSRMVKFSPQGNFFVATINRSTYKAFLSSTNRLSLEGATGPVAEAIPAGDSPSSAILNISEELKWEFCDWMTKSDRQLGYLDENLYHAPIAPPEGEPASAFYCRIESVFGTLIINSTPTGAAILNRGEQVGTTQDTLRLRRGPFELVLRKDGFQEVLVSGHLQDEAPVPKWVMLKPAPTVLYPR